MQSTILLALLLQVVVISCGTPESNGTGNANINNNQTNNQVKVTSQDNVSVNKIDENNSSVSSINKNSIANLSSSTINETNEDNSGVTNLSSISINETNEMNTSVTNIKQVNDTVSNPNEINDTRSAEMTSAESSTSEEVILTGTPVMRDCVNGTTDTSVCMSKMLNLTLECANETGATQDDVDIAMRMEIPSSDTGKCLTRCLLKHRGVMSPEGVFSTTGTVEYLIQVHKNESLPQEFQKLADYCFGKFKLQPMSSLDTCQFAYDIALCTEEYHKTLFLRNPAMAPPVNAITTP